MTDKKLTDEEIIKGLECCKDCSINLNFEIVQKIEDKNKEILELIDIINSLKAEIEKLKEEVKDKERAYNDEFRLRKEWQSKCQELLKDKQTTKSETIKEFAERLKDEMRLEDDCRYDCMNCFYECKGYVPIIDNLVKEMTEVQE